MTDRSGGWLRGRLQAAATEAMTAKGVTINALAKELHMPIAVLEGIVRGSRHGTLLQWSALLNNLDVEMHFSFTAATPAEPEAHRTSEDRCGRRANSCQCIRPQYHAGDHLCEHGRWPTRRHEVDHDPLRSELAGLRRQIEGLSDLTDRRLSNLEARVKLQQGLQALVTSLR